MNIPQQKQSGLICIVIALFLILSGCGREEIQNLRSENEALKNKVASLELEISKLKETADYHYQQGVDFLSSQDYGSAKSEFETVIEKYPLSPLVTPAKQQLVKVKDALAKIEAQRIAEERLRQEAEKYREKSPEEADEEWLKFRNNESKYRGTVTTWRMQCFSLDYYSGFLDSLHYYALCSMGNLPNPRTVKLDLTYEQSRKIREDDWLIVTGRFEYVTKDGRILMKAIKIKNLGAQ